MTKFIFLSFLLLPFAVSIPWPPISGSENKASYDSFCKAARCASVWLDRHPEKSIVTRWNCSRLYDRYSPIATLQYLLKVGHIDLNWMKYDLKVREAATCAYACKLNDFFRWYYVAKQTTISNNTALVKYNLRCAFKDKPYCAAQAGFKLFRFIFGGALALPFAFILTTVNIATLCQMLHADAGAALYLHLAETVSDGLFTLFVSVTDWMDVFGFIDAWNGPCRRGQYFSWSYFGFGIQKYLYFLNQCFLAGLVYDRALCVKDPLEYHSIPDQKQRSRRIILRIVFISLLIYSPFLTLNSFDNLVRFWNQNWLAWQSQVRVIKYCYSVYFIFPLVPLGLQVVCGYQLNEVLKSKTNLDTRGQEKLVSSIVNLNLTTTVVNCVASVIRTGRGDLFVKAYPYPVHLFLAVDMVLTLLNGSGAMLMHLVFVKMYRAAFLQSKLGRFFCPCQGQNAVVPVSQGPARQLSAAYRNEDETPL